LTRLIEMPAARGGCAFGQGTVAADGNDELAPLSDIREAAPAPPEKSSGFAFAGRLQWIGRRCIGVFSNSDA